MDFLTSGIIAVVFVTSLCLTGCFRRMALRRGFLDIPNHRSSHQNPTPRGGGVVFATVSLVALGIFWALGIVSSRVTIGFIGAGAMVAVVSYQDDIRTVSWAVRLGIQAVAAFWGVVWLGGMPFAPLGHWSFVIGWAGVPLAALGIIWMCNLYNFMDGIDGLAGSQGVFVGVSLAGLAILQGAEPIAFTALILAASTAGFLVWNWPPARLFMGDTGATFLGLMFGLLLLSSVNAKNVSAWAVLILMGAFLTDATVTLIRRLRQGKAFTEPHRFHAFQHMAQRWGHQKTTLAFIAVNIGWLCPMAFVAQHYSLWSPLIAIAAFAPLVGMAFYWSAGRARAVK